MQHEFDHLDGKMFIDHISPLRKQMIKGKLNTMLTVSYTHLQFVGACFAKSEEYKMKNEELGMKN